MRERGIERVEKEGRGLELNKNVARDKGEWWGKREI